MEFQFSHNLQKNKLLYKEVKDDDSVKNMIPEYEMVDVEDNVIESMNDSAGP